ncbi:MULTISPECIES: AMIN domain-containing protein [Corallococcus]|uniref:AMIN domain-containing protein n=1 Tax=Corallococcus TaxID=83461 RepID=UPI00117F72CB|nr:MULTISPECIES: AMIN domain-containing protein [Corallococcus]NBD10719.1 AMIN domain-containing protein [Corallococcus silvisoli]TSC31824.1 AMIN domain-containing protein [Corallococcus sp. Z5C101001]
MKGFAVSLLGWMLVPLVALAQQPADLNTITGITINGGTVEISGSKKPDFNSFTMTDPPRLVIDVSGAVFQGVAEEMPVGNGTVTGIRTQVYGTELSSIARILIGYEREVETDIQSSGTKLVVKVLGGGGNAAVAQNTPAQGTAEIASATQTPTGASAQDAARAAASDREAQEKAAKAAADAARAEREAQEKAAAEASARAKADADADRKRQEDARLAAQRQEEERRASEAAAVAERKRQDEDARAAAKRAEDERRASAQAAADAKRQQAEEAQAAARSAAEEKRAAAKRAEDERRASAQAAAEEKRTSAQAAAEAKRQKLEEARAAAQARREEQQEAREAAAEAKRQKAQEARERRQPTAVASRETRARPSQGSAAAEPRESGGGQVSSRRKTMTLVGFQQHPDSSSVFVRTNEPVRYTVSESANQVVLELENTRVVESNNTLPLDTHFFPSAVSRVEAFSGAGHSVRVVIQLKQGVRYQTRQEGGLITLDFPRPGR